MKQAYSRVAGILVCSFFGAVVVYILNYFIIDRILIPDPCAYHGEETTKIFNIFYKRESSEGYHPEPTFFNYILTVVLGAASGFFVYKRIYRKKNK